MHDDVRNPTERVGPSTVRHLDEHHYRVLLERASDLALICDRALVIQWAGPSLGEMFGYPAEDVIGVDGMQFVHPDDAERLRLTWDRLVAAPGKHERLEIRVKHRDGSWRWVEERMTNLLDEPNVRGVVLNVRDTTEQRLATEALAERERFLTSILETTQEGVWVADADGRSVFANDRMAQLLHVDRELLHGVPVWQFFDPAAAREVEYRFSQRSTGLSGRYELAYLDGRGDQRVARVSASPLFDDAGAFVGGLGVVSDITDRKAMEDALERLSLYDPLTALPNRTLLHERLHQQVSLRAQRGDEFALLMADIDHMNLVNARHGLAVGDALIAAVGQRLQETAREGDTVARVAGDEFAVLCPGADPYAAQRLAEAHAAAASEPITVGDLDLHITLSIGAASTTDTDPDDLMASAERGIVAAKAAGRARVALHNSATWSAEEDRTHLAEELRAAMQRNELEVWYQPIVTLADSTIRGAEALLRWTHSERGPVSPAQFIPVAEEFGLIHELGAMTLRAACHDAVRWPDRSGGWQPLVSVNLSAEQLAAPAVVETVADILRVTGLAPARLILEVTETALLADMQAAVGTLKQLRALGVNIALDDFGTGYSSLEYLRRLPANAIKVDRSFVSGLGRNPDDTAIVAAVVSLGATVGVQVIAEGVETPEQHEILRRLGCPLGQGYLWNAAVPADELDTVFTTIETQAAPATEKPARRSRQPQPDVATRGRILALHRAGASLATIAAALNGEGKTTPSGSRWHHTSVARVVAAANYPDQSLPL